jgi:hypothetical protein
MYSRVPTTRPVAVTCSAPATRIARAIPNRHDRVTRLKQDVARLDIPVHDTGVVSVGERVRDFPGDLDGVAWGQPLLANQQVAQRLPCTYGMT